MKSLTIKLTEERAAHDMVMARTQEQHMRVLTDLEKALEKKEAEVFDLLEKQRTLEAKLRAEIQADIER